MDPITQGALGAVAAQAFYPKAKRMQAASLFPATVIAALAAMSPDLDVLIRSDEDPLLFLVYHRQFTHSLIFIPFGALFCALILYPLFARRHHFSKAETYLLCFTGYATHGLLDACTTYGTMLYWPFSNERVAWHNVGVIDLFFTVPLLFAIWLGIKWKKRWPALLAVLWVFTYLYVGLLQKERAELVAHDFWIKNVADRPEPLTGINAKPTLLNLWVWKLVYETETRFYVDAVHLGFFDSLNDAVFYPGERIEKLDLKKDFLWLDKNSQQAKDIARFAWFSMDYVAVDPKNENRIIDVRYSIVPNTIDALWSIELNPDANAMQHVQYHQSRETSERMRNIIISMLKGEALVEEDISSDENSAEKNNAENSAEESSQ